MPQIPDGTPATLLEPAETRRAKITMEMVSGPLPPPQVLADYGKVDPTFPNRIMEMAEREQRHSHEQYTALVDGVVRSIFLGQLWVGVVCVIGMLCGTTIIILGDSSVLITLIGAAVSFMSFAGPILNTLLRQKKTGQQESEPSDSDQGPAKKKPENKN